MAILGLSASSKAAASVFGSFIAVTVLALAGTAFAQDPPPTSLDQAIATLDAALKNEPGLSEQTKQALSAVVGTLRTERAEVVTTSKVEKMIDEYSKRSSAFAKRKSFESVFDHLKIFGDFRFRLEGDLNRDDQPERFRPRVRFRLGMDWALTDELSLNTRLVTGDPSDAQSPHQTLGTTFNKWDSNWDRLHLTYKPKCVDGLTVWLGKFNSPFYTNPVYGELVWDQDVGAEGVAAKYTVKGDECSILEKIDFALGAYDFIESDLFDDTFALVAQVAATFKLSKCFSATGAVGYYLWGGPVAGANAVLTGDNSGNVAIDTNGDMVADQFQSDFGIFNPIVSTTFSKWEKWPITFSAEYILNTEAENDRDQGFAIGASAGRTQKKGDWKFYYQYQLVEQDAVFTPVAGDDFILQTNFSGHVGGIWYMVTDDINLHLWTLIAAREDLGTSATTDSDQDQWRFRLDLNIRF
jgi:hypothetical protein